MSNEIFQFILHTNIGQIPKFKALDPKITLLKMWQYIKYAFLI